MKKALRETQTLSPAAVPPQTHRVCDGCSKAEPKYFHRRRPPFRGRRTAKI